MVPTWFAEEGVIETNWGLYNDRQNSTYCDEIDMSNTFY